MKTLLKRASAVVAGGALAFSGLAVASAAPAAAAVSPVDVTGIKVYPSYGGTAINASTKGYRIATTARQVAPIPYSATIYVDVYRAGTRVAANVQAAYIGSGYTNMTGYLTVQNSWGRGPFYVSNVRVQWNDANYVKQTAVDSSVAGRTFSVKSGLKASGKVRYWYGSSKKVANIKLQRFSSNGKYTNYKTKVKLQRKKSGKWRTVKTLKLNSKGKAKYTFRSSKKYKYRFVVKGTSTTAGGVFTTYGKA
ncbi:hypothetical protein FE697_010760 [Mumia zhuanghuii]|uniref:Uncharacterized protein n=2 Tax=Mumia TaxID=1546255 RepID=A0ABW1QHQ6_9ACTN|nr:MULTISPECIES: hypothetical protein [Mumia]KAA1422660.1 hypothetical protein FE697_010760 [Mumia zhuanghuii]